jgi:hypothetical protein
MARFRLSPTGWAATLACALSIGACSPYQPRVDVEQAPAFTAAGYQTWNYVDPLGMERAGYAPAVVERAKIAFEESMRERGYERAPQPDLLVDIAADIRDEGDASMHSDPVQAIHSNTGTFQDSWRGYGEGFGNSTRQGRYGSGRMSVGLIDMESRELVWEAVAEGRLSGSRSEAALLELVDGVTRQMVDALPAANP